MVNQNDVRILLSQNLKRARTNKNLSQLALSNVCGIATGFINEIEHGRKWISPDTIEKLCDALDIQPYQLFVPESNLVVDKDATIAACCDEIVSETKRVIEEVRKKHLG